MSDKEYVFRIVSRDPKHKLVETPLIELGWDADEVKRIPQALAIVVELFDRFKTPEAVRDFMQDAESARKLFLPQGT